MPNFGHRSALIHGLILHRMGHFDEACQRYAQAIEAAQHRLCEDERFWSARITQAIAMAGQGAVEPALEVLKAMPVLSEFRGVHDNLMSLATELPERGGNFAEAAMELQPAGRSPYFCTQCLKSLDVH